MFSVHRNSTSTPQHLFSVVLSTSTSEVLVHQPVNYVFQLFFFKPRTTDDLDSFPPPLPSTIFRASSSLFLTLFLTIMQKCSFFFNSCLSDTTVDTEVIIKEFPWIILPTFYNSLQLAIFFSDCNCKFSAAKKYSIE